MSEDKSLLDPQDDIELREFRASDPGAGPSPDDASCKELEKNSTMIPSHLKWLVNGHTIHKANFDYKINMYPAGFIIVAESKSGGVVGMVCGAVKEITLHWKPAGKPVKAVYIFDLRVSQSHQKHGLGKRLVDRAHARAHELGANYAYLTVNGDNDKAQKLFLKLGYSECSKRFPVGSKFGQHSQAQSDSDDFKVGKVIGDKAVELLQKELKEHDFAPNDLERLAKSDFYLGTVVASCGESFASVSLWNGSGVTTFCISRFLFPSEWYTYALFRYALLAVGLLMCGWWVCHIHSCFSDGSTVWAVIYMVLTAVSAVGVKKMCPLLDFVWMMMQNKDGNMKTRGRLFAPVQRGPRGTECLTAAVTRGKQELVEQGFLAWICNLDADSPLRSSFDAPGNFVAKLMHKSLDGSEEALPCTFPDDFHDPRDI